MFNGNNIFSVPLHTFFLKKISSQIEIKQSEE